MKAKPRILIVDDDPLVRRSCERILGQEYEVQLAQNGQEGVSSLESGACDLALVDLKLPDLDGMEILRRAPDRYPDVPLIMITGYSTIKSAVERSDTAHKLLTTQGTPVNMKPAGNPTYSSALPTSISPVSQAESVTSRAADMSTSPPCKSANVRYPSARARPDLGGSFQLYLPWQEKCR